jgi:hypothetical protein
MKKGLVLLSKPKLLLEGRAPFMSRLYLPAFNIPVMISPVNQYEQLVCARLLDFFSSRTHWNRGLWNVGTILALHEVLEASEAQRDGHLSEKTIKGATTTAIRLLRLDPGVGTDQQRATLLALLTVNGEARDELLFQGLEFEAIAEQVRQVSALYLDNWSRAVAPGPQPPPPERTARAIAAHMLDAGFHSDFLHRWWTAHLRKEERTSLSQVLQGASALLNRADTEYEVLVAFPSPLIPPRGLLPPQSWRNATEVVEWLGRHEFDSDGLRQQGGLLLRVSAREPESAVQAAAERVETFCARVLLSLRKEIKPLPLAWVAGTRNHFSLERRLRGIKIGAMHRENRIWLESDPDAYIDPAIDLLTPLQIGSSSAAIAGGWAAIESLLGEPKNKRADPAERLATIVACSFPRAELTDLAFAFAKRDGRFRAEVSAAATNKERAQLTASWIIADTLPDSVSWSDKAAIERMRDLFANPQDRLKTIRDHVNDTFTRLYRQRNLVLHAGRTQAVALRATLRTAAPLVGAGLDRISQARFAKNMRPIQLAGRARTSLENVVIDSPLKCIDLLGI